MDCFALPAGRARQSASASTDAKKTGGFATQQPAAASAAPPPTASPPAASGPPTHAPAASGPADHRRGCSSAAGRPAAADVGSIGRRRCSRRRGLSCSTRATCTGSSSVRAGACGPSGFVSVQKLSGSCVKPFLEIKENRYLDGLADETSKFEFHSMLPMGDKCSRPQHCAQQNPNPERVHAPAV